MELAQENLSEVGLDAMPTIEVNQTKVNSYVAAASGLPTSVTQKTTNENGDEVETTYTVLWVIRDTEAYQKDVAYENYTYSKVSSNDTIQYLQLLTDVTFNVVGKVGGQELDDLFQQRDERFRFYATADGKNVLPAIDEEVGQPNSLVLADPINETGAFGLKWISTEEDDGETGTLEGRLPAYNKDGLPIVYSITYEDESTTEGDYYQVVYDNQNSPNHGGDVTAAFPGGTMTLIRVGTTTFDAEKVVLDDDANDRPVTTLTFTLWRYSSQDAGGFKTASQVSLTTKDEPNAEPHFAYIEIPIAGDKNIYDLGGALDAKYGPLPKYDSDGYPYVYALREDTSIQDYEMIFGALELDPNGNEINRTDAAPSYRDADGNSIPVKTPEKAWPGSTWTRDDANHFIYDKGTITNRKVDTVTVPFTKTWIAAAFQDQLEDVTVKFQAQCRPVGSTGEWTNAEGEDATVEMTDWFAEQMTQSKTGTFPKYNDQGQELEYRWIEHSVKQGDDGEEQILSDLDNEFTLKLTDALGEQVEVTFLSEYDEATKTFTNTFENKTNHYVKKLWKTYNNEVESDATPDPGTQVTVKLYRDQKYVRSFTLDGDVDELAETCRIEIGDGESVEYTVQETEKWFLEIKGLPEYSNKGEHYSYLVVETKVENGHSDRDYDPKGYTNSEDGEECPLTTITNTQGLGVSTDIPVSKSWTDGSDNTHHLPSVVEVVAARDLTADDGIVYSKDYVVGYAVLTEENGWYEELTVPGAWNWQTDFKLREVGLAKSNGVQSGAWADETPDDLSGSVFPAYNNPDAVPNDEDNQEWAQYGWVKVNDQYPPRIATDDHVYEVTYQIVANENEP